MINKIFQHENPFKNINISTGTLKSEVLPLEKVGPFNSPTIKIHYANKLQDTGLPNKTVLMDHPADTKIGDHLIKLSNRPDLGIFQLIKSNYALCIPRIVLPLLRTAI